MNIDNEAKIISFNNDDDFCQYAVDPSLKLYGDGPDYYDWDFNDAYKKNVGDCFTFLMRDLNSQIMKRGGVCCHGQFKDVKLFPDWDHIDSLVKDYVDECEKEECQKHIEDM